ncbi:MAG: HDOD domain-containing protein [Acidobacteriota bacterium]
MGTPQTRGPGAERQRAVDRGSETTPQESPVVFIARQPVFDVHKRVWAYELLFRGGNTGSAQVTDDAAATAHVLRTTFLDLGLEYLTGGLPALVNFSERHLVDQLPNLFPPAHLIVEVLESVRPTPEVTAALRELKRAGYRLALDDLGVTELPETLLPLADILKVDFLALDAGERSRITKALRTSCRNSTLFLAEKVETLDDFDQGRRLDCHLFQGYFFAKPVVLKEKAIPSHKLTRLRLLQELANPEFEFRRIEAVVKSDISVTTKLLRYINAAAFPWSRRIESVGQALVLLGENQVRKWLSIVTLSELCCGSPFELLRAACLRGRFCELLGSQLRGYSELDCFLVGALANLDAMLGTTKEAALEKLTLPEPVKNALSGCDCALAKLLVLATSYERAEWDRVHGLATELGIREDSLPKWYMEALAWTESLFTPSGEA